MGRRPDPDHHFQYTIQWSTESCELPKVQYAFANIVTQKAMRERGQCLCRTVHTELALHDGPEDTVSSGLFCIWSESYLSLFAAGGGFCVFYGQERSC